MMRRLLRWTALGLALTILSAVVLLGVIAGSETALRFALAELDRRAGEHFDLESLEGRLLGPLQLRGLRFQVGGWRVTADSVTLRWRPAAMIGSEIHIIGLRGEGLTVTAPAASAPPQADTAERTLPAIGLPFTLRLDRLVVDDLAFKTGPEAEPLTLEQIVLGLWMRGPEVRLRTLQVDHPRFRISAEGHLNATGSWPLEADLAWTARLPDMPALQGRTSLSGDLSALSVSQRTLEPYPSRLQATIDNPLGEIRWRAQWSTDGLEPAKLDPAMAAITIAGQVRANGDRHTAAIQTRLSVTGTDMPTLAIAAEGRRTGEILTLQSLRITRPGTELQLGAEGRIDLTRAGDPAAALTLTWQDLSWPGIPVVSPRGEARLEGRLSAYHVDLEGRVHARERTDTPADIEMQGQGDTRHLALSRLRVRLAQGEIGGSGRLAWTPTLSWQAQLTAKGVNPAILHREFPGHLDARLHAQGRLNNGQWQASAALDELEGRLRRQAVDGEIRVELDGGNLRIPALRLRLGDNRLTAEGTLTERWQGKADLSAQNLAQLAPTLSGAVEARLDLHGPRRRPTAAIDLQGRDITFADHGVARLVANGRLATGEGEHSDLTVDLSDADLGGWRLGAASLRITGPTHSLDIRLAAELAQRRLELAIDGALDVRRPGFEGTLRGARLTSERYPPWQLGAAAAIEASAQTARLEAACWQSGEASLCLDLKWRRDEGGRLTAELGDFPLNRLEAMGPARVRGSGRLDADSALRLTADGRLFGSLDARLADGALYQSSADREPLQLLAVNPMTLSLHARPTGLTAELSGTLNDDGRLEGKITVPAYDGRPDAVSGLAMGGRLRADLNDLGIISALTTEVSDADGSLRADLALSGSLGSPHIAGAINLAEGRFEIPRYGLDLRAVRIDAETADAGGIGLLAEASSGSGRLRAEGNLALQAGQPRLELSVSGSRFLVVDTAEASLYVSPDIQFSLHGQKAELTGLLEVPRARIEPRDLEDTVTPSADQVIVGDTAKQQPEPLQLVAKLRVVLGEQVRFEGFGLEGNLEGNIRLTDMPGAPTTATGEARIVDGVYRAYGQNLKIETGRIVFTGGPVDNPGLDVRAVRQLPDVTVGVRVRGQLRTPEISLFSEPPMAESDQLAYLLFGRPLNRTSTEEGETLNQAATALGLAGGRLLAERFGERFGLDEVRVESEGPTDQAALVVGRYLSPRLYVSYGLGIFTGLSTFTARYEINENWTLESQSSALGSGADIIYSIEFGEPARPQPPQPDGAKTDD